MRDTPIVVATCNRCKAYVFACEVNGCKSAVDITPLDVEAYRGALVSGRATYDQLEQAGRPWKLHARGPSSEWPPFANRKVLGEHQCTRGMNVTGFDVSEVPAPKAHATVTGTETSSLSHGAPVVATRADSATRHLTKYVNYVCKRCGVMIGRDRTYVGIEYNGRWLWAQHDYPCGT